MAWRIKTEDDILLWVGNLKSCSVGFVDAGGIRHTAEVTAESLFEAAVLGIDAIVQNGGCSPPVSSTIEIEVRAPSVRHEIAGERLRTWISSASPSPKEKLLKSRLRELLAS